VPRISLSLPWPPTTGNHQHGRRGRCVYVLDAVVTYRQQVAVLASMARVRVAGRVRVMVDLTPPDKRRRDADNALKLIFDALVRAGVLEDDSNRVIVEHTVRWHAAMPYGAVDVSIEEVRDEA
jgi:crossover junction endodeoxyribonuclease RusA